MSDKGDIINREETVNERVASINETLNLDESKEAELTEFEKIELGMFERIYTIGKIRR